MHIQTLKIIINCTTWENCTVTFQIVSAKVQNDILKKGLIIEIVPTKEENYQNIFFKFWGNNQHFF